MAAATMTKMATAAKHRVVCVGDVHGNVDKLRALFGHLQRLYGADGMSAATVVFLGDYCDRGSDPAAAIEWLCDYAERRRQAAADAGTAAGSSSSSRCGDTVFLAGNHDLGMAAYLGLLTAPEGVSLDATRPPHFKSGFFAHPVEGGMHYIGRRWGGSPSYNAAATFASYGVKFEYTAAARDALLAAVPEHHKAFLRRLEWVYDARVAWSPGRVVCVHAGLNGDVPVAAQIAALRARAIGAAALETGGFGRISPLQARDRVYNMPAELDDVAVLVSGHHGFRGRYGERFICDRSGGYAGDEHVLEALVLPERVFVGHLGSVSDGREVADGNDDGGGDAETR